MNPTHDLARRMADYYATEAPARAPERVLAQVLDTIDITPQRRSGLGRAWRLPSRTPVAKLAVGAMAVAAVGFGLTLMQGSVMGPAASPSPTPTASVQPMVSGGMWPQTSLEEVRQAQALADAGDPAYEWQISRSRWQQVWQHHPMNTEFFARFTKEELGWEDFHWDEAFAHPDGLVDGDVVYIRCAPDRRISLYPEYAGCAPTIDESRYEMVKINVAQLIREGPAGIWVVTGWEMIGSPDEIPPPPSDAQISSFLAPFFQARIEGAGAEGFAEAAKDDPVARDRVVREIPLLYTTTTAARYERAEFEIVEGPVWPSVRMQLKVKLYAENDKTVVEQLFALERDESGRLRLVYDFVPTEPAGSVPSTTENGKAVPIEYGFLDGEVTYRAAHPLAPSTDGYRAADQVAIEGLLPDDGAPRRVLVMVADPRPVGPGCVEASAPDAAALVRSIASDADVEATAPVDVTIGGAPALRIDMVLAAASSACSWKPFLLANAPGPVDRARIYLVDLPGGSGRVLALATITDEDSFQTVLDWAAPVVDSIEFHAP